MDYLRLNDLELNLERKAAAVAHESVLLHNFGFTLRTKTRERLVIQNNISNMIFHL